MTPILQKNFTGILNLSKVLLETNCSYLSSLSERIINNNELPEEIGPASKTSCNISSRHKERLTPLWCSSPRQRRMKDEMKGGKKLEVKKEQKTFSRNTLMDVQLLLSTALYFGINVTIVLRISLKWNKTSFKIVVKIGHETRFLFL